MHVSTLVYVCINKMYHVLFIRITNEILEQTLVVHAKWTVLFPFPVCMSMQENHFVHMIIEK